MPPNIQYTTINDFRPGIVDNIRQGSLAGGVLELPLGTARTGTGNCIALPTGQLAPLSDAEPFGNNPTITLNTTPNPGGTINTPCGLVSDGTNQVHAFISILGSHAPNPQDNLEWWKCRLNTAPTLIKVFNGQTLPGQAQTLRGITRIRTRGRRSSFSSVGFPILALEWTSSGVTDPGADGAIQFYDIYPDPNNLTSNTPFEETGTVNNAAALFGGQLVAHSSRILRFCEESVAHGVSDFIVSNERTRYTDPPNSVSLAATTTDSYFDPQDYGPFGAWGSISFGELLLIKKNGGALLVEGDVYAPQVTRLPGVKSTGSVVQPATSTPIGMVYCVSNDGAYVWNGGSSSTKISKVNDNFFLNPNGAIQFGVNVSHCLWGELVVFTNGWVYDTTQDAWWQLINPYAGAAANILWVTPGIDGNTLYVIADASDSGTFTGTTFTINRYRRSKGATAYIWNSQPIPVSVNTSIDVHEVLLSISNVTNAGAFINVTLTSMDAAPVTTLFPFSTTGAGPFYSRLPMGLRGRNVSVSITSSSNSTTPAPIINSISVGWTEAGPYGAR